MKGIRMLAGLLALLSGAMQGASPPATLDRDRVVEMENFDHELLAREIFRVTNEVRVKEGVIPLKPDPRLTAAANDQATVLSLRIHSGHDSPLLHQGDPYERVERSGLREGTVAENAATMNVRDKITGRNPAYRELAAVIVQAWMDSPGHRANLLNPGLHYLGCGARVAYMLQHQLVVYAIQDFYTPAPLLSEPPPPTIRPAGTSITR